MKLTVSTQDKASQLREAGWQVWPLQLHGDAIPDSHADFFDADILIVTVPPNGRREPPALFQKRLAPLRDWVEKGPIDWLIYTSSTGVYERQNAEVTEGSPKRAAAPTWGAEQLFDQWSVDVSVLRFGGLFGDERNPARYFEGRQEIPDGDAPINFVHLNDCVGAAQHLLAHNLRNEVFNVVCSEHPTRAGYYREQCKALGLALPSFLAGTGEYNIVSNSKLLESGYAMREHLPENV